MIEKTIKKLMKKFEVSRDIAINLYQYYMKVPKSNLKTNEYKFLAKLKF